MIIATASQKGGVGKTTTAYAIANVLADRGNTVLAVDLDPQSNLTYCLGARSGAPGSLRMLMGEVTAAEAAQHVAERIDVIPAEVGLSALEQLVTGTGKEYRLKECLDSVRKKYDFFIIDCPPSLGLSTVMALTAADTLVIPTSADVFGLQGLEQLRNNIAAIQKYTNPGLDVAGILLTRFNSRSSFNNEAREVITSYAEKMQTRVFDTAIRETVEVKKAQIAQRPLPPKSMAAQDYRNFIDELLEVLKK